MTRKDYIKFANMLKRHEQYEYTDTASIMWRSMVEDTADIFADDNPNFKRDKFYEACGYV